LAAIGLPDEAGGLAGAAAVCVQPNSETNNNATATHKAVTENLHFMIFTSQGFGQGKFGYSGGN
jgi:hypothetical protein